MPTGYTSDVSKDISFETFALNCARAFGACVTMRDESADTPIPKKFTPNPYHVKEMAKLKKEEKRILAMTTKEALACATKVNKEKIAELERDFKEMLDLKAKYEKMLAKVHAWTPPTPEHDGLKTFMIDQLTESIKFDCDPSYYSSSLTSAKRATISAEKWLKDELTRINRDMAYHIKENKEEIKRAESRTEWVEELRKSLG